MSWLTDIAGKAENFLNKIDSEAALILSDSKNDELMHKSKIDSEIVLSKTDFNPAASHTPQRYIHRTSADALPSSSGVPGELHSFFLSPTRNKTKSTFTAEMAPSNSNECTSVKVLNANLEADVQKIEFSSVRIVPEKISLKPAASASCSVRTTPNHSRESSLDHATFTSSLSQDPSPAAVNPVLEDISSHHSRQSSLSSRASSAHDGANNAFTTITLESSCASSVVSSGSSQLDSFVKVDHNCAVSSQNAEANLLKKEIMSLNQEIKLLMTREKNNVAELQSLRAAQSSGSGQLAILQRRLCELQQQEFDLQEAVACKDDEISRLRDELQQLKTEVSSKAESLSKYKQENVRLCQGASVLSGRHSEAMESVQSRLEEAQGALERERAMYAQQQLSLSNSIQSLQCEKKLLQEQLKDINTKLQAEKSRVTALQCQVASAKQEVSDAEQQLESYKTKARLILSSKESLIEALKEGKTLADSDVDQSIMLTELTQMRAELALARDELSKGTEQQQRLRSLLNEQECSAEQEVERCSAYIAELEDRLAEQRKVNELLEEDVTRTKEVSRLLQEEVSLLKVEQGTALQQAQAEVISLRRELAQCSVSASSNAVEELQKRVAALSDALLQKQSSVDALTSELQATNLQLSRVQQQQQIHRDAIASDDLRIRVPTLLLETPFDGGVTRRVKRAYSSLDRFSVGLGVFLRRYPVARILVLLYMLLLHAWVLLVLLTYTPEIHPSDYQSLSGCGGQQPPLPPAPGPL